MHRRTFLAFALAGTAGLGLIGCGFRLRGLDGPVALPPALALSGPDSDLQRLVRSRLDASGSRVHDDAPWQLNLGAEHFRQRHLSVLDAGPRDEEMTLNVPFSVQRRADGAYLLDQQWLEVSTRYTVSDTDLLGQEDLRAEARQELRNDAVRQLFDRLASLPTTP